jgi:hypothetical protein
MDWRHIRELVTAGESLYGELKNISVWVKNNGGMGSVYRSQHEFIFVFKHLKIRIATTFNWASSAGIEPTCGNYPGANSFSRGI